jgi:hypothetical protein
MKQTKKILEFSFTVLLFCLILPLTQLQASGINSSDDNLLGIESNAKKFSLLDPQRLKISHSYTFSYFSNSTTSGSFGVYATTLRYQLSDPLSLTLNLNYLHQPLSVFRQNSLGVKESILPNFQLHYKPSNNFSLWINVLTLPSSYYYNNMNNRYPW